MVRWPDEPGVSEEYVSSAIATHAAATDPHGDRSYAAALVGRLPEPPRAGAWLHPPHTATANTSFTSGILSFVPIPVPAETAIDRLACWVTTQAGTTGTARLGIYADNGFGVPGALVVDGGTYSITTTGIKDTMSVSASLSRGLYWLAALIESTGTAASLVATSSSSISPLLTSRTSAFGGAGGTPHHGWRATGQSGSLPASAPSVTSSNGVALLAARMA